MEILGVPERDIELFRGDTLRESWLCENPDGSLVDISAFTFVREFYLLETGVSIVTLDETRLSTTEVETFLSTVPSAALPTDVDIIGHRWRFTTPAGDVQTFDHGRVLLRSR